MVVSLILSVLEGCALQRQLMGPRGIDIQANFELWESLLAPYLERWGEASKSAEADPEHSRRVEAMPGDPLTGTGYPVPRPPSPGPTRPVPEGE